MFDWKEPKKLCCPKEKVVFTSEPFKVRTRQPRKTEGMYKAEKTKQPIEKLTPNDNIMIDGTKTTSIIRKAFTNIHVM